MHHFKTQEEDDRISHRVASADNPLDIQFSQLMDDFQLGLMAEPDEGEFLLAAEEVNVGVDIMIVNGDGVVMGGMPQQMEVFEAPYPEFHVQQHVDGIIVDNGGIACINDSTTVESNGEIYVPVQPLRMLTSDNVEIFSVLEVPVPVQPLRIFTPDNGEIPVIDVQPLRVFTPDNREIPVDDVPVPVQPLRIVTPDNREIPVDEPLGFSDQIIEGVQPLRIFTPDNREIPVTNAPLQPLEIPRPDYAEFLATYVPFVVQPLRSVEPEYEGNKQMDNGDEAGPSET
ncbi:hypothetical protein DCAR_0625694 [Daucus carota subsp. sativus]|uniref:Uncharacterized protein n=1 Tax=Daucus carota subsp. sativus TaxID=79200 RepID=A0A164WMB6_DAUCS|nr:hypothetical protein DCAR_0625694 [Daucus carota subsp. sativus]